MPASQKPPRPPLVDRLRHAVGDRAAKLSFLLSCAATYGDVVDLSLGLPTFLIADPDDIRHILETNHQNYTKTRHLLGATGQRLYGRGLLTSSGQEALSQRRMLNPLFGRQALSHYDATIVTLTRDMLAGWEAEVDIAAEMQALAQRILVKVLLSVDVAREAPQLRQALSLRRRHTEHYFRWPIPLSDRVPTPATRARLSATRVVDQWLAGLIKTRRGDPAPPDDWLTALLCAHEGALTDQQIRDQLWTLLETGYETIGLVMAWMWHLLATHPEVQDAMAAEVESVLGSGTPSAGDVSRLGWIERCMSETMRLYPPTWIFVRVPREDDGLPSGFRAPAGAKLYLSPYVSHRLPRYFAEPERFDPDRFSDPARRGRPRLAYFPFSSGPRNCLGQGFALMEGPLITACIAQRFRVEPAPGFEPQPEPGLTLAPREGIRVRLQRR